MKGVELFHYPPNSLKRIKKKYARRDSTVWSFRCNDLCLCFDYSSSHFFCTYLKGLFFLKFKSKTFYCFPLLTGLHKHSQFTIESTWRKPSCANSFKLNFPSAERYNDLISMSTYSGLPTYRHNHKKNNNQQVNFRVNFLPKKYLGKIEKHFLEVSIIQRIQSRDSVTSRKLPRDNF